MNKLTLFLIATLFTIQLFGQNGKFDVRFKLHSVDCATNKLFLDLEIRADNPSEAFSLSDMNFRFNFNGALANPALDQELTITGNVVTTTPASNSFYSTHTLTGTSNDIVSYNVSLSGGDGYPLNDVDYVGVGRISFDIVNSNMPIMLTFLSKVAGDFPATFIGEKFNSALFIADEGSYNNYLQNDYCMPNTVPTTANDTGTGTPGITDAHCVLMNDSDSETMLDFNTLAVVTVPTPSQGSIFVDKAAGCIEFTPASGFSGAVSITYSICDDGNLIPSVRGADNPVPVSLPDPLTLGVATITPLCNTAVLTVNVSGGGGVKVSPKVFLEGPFNAGAGEMSIGVNTANLLPTSEPYTALGIHTGTETTTAAVLTSNSIVDWVLVELRDAANPATIIATRAALLDNQGNVTDTDGVSPVDFTIAGGNYHVAVIHRNHLGIMTDNALALSALNSTVDLTTLPLFGVNPTKVVNGVQVMWTGDSNTDYTINAADRSNAWNDRNLSQYLGTDFTLDGVVNAADRSVCWNNRNLSAQLP